MKCCIMAVGGAGEQIARAYGYCALAGLTREESARILMVDTDAREDTLDSWCADHALLRSLWPEGEAPRGFGTAVSCSRWPGELPQGVTDLRSLVSSGEDELLLRALFDADAAGADLRRGAKGHGEAALVLMTGLLGGEAGPQGELDRLLRELEQAQAEGEDVRVVLAGSAMGGMGAAGLTVLARYLQSRLPGAEIAATVLLPYFRGEEDQLEQARAALAQWGQDGLCPTVYMMGLPQAAYLTAAEGHQLARLPEWLAGLCAADFFRTGRKGCYGWQTACDSFGWEAFGEYEAACREGFGNLLRVTLALRIELAEVIRRGVKEPLWLRDKFIGWYAPHFLQVKKLPEEQKNAILLQLDALCRLTEGYAAWLGEIIAMLPPQLREGSAMDAAIRDYRSNYDLLVKQSAQLDMMVRNAERSGLAISKVVHRGDYGDTEDDQAQVAIEAARRALQELENKQEACIRRTGGQAHIALLQEAARLRRREADAFRQQTEEAARLIRRAEESADVTGRGRIANARTKLYRMEQSLEVLEARCRRVEADIHAARASGVRTLPPEITPEKGIPACALFSAGAAAAADRRALAEGWQELVSGGEALSYPQRLEIIARAQPQQSPMAGFIQGLMHTGKEDA